MSYIGFELGMKGSGPVLALAVLIAIAAVGGFSLYDMDGDGLRNYQEWLGSTTWNAADSDGDNLSDRLEMELGTDPTKVDSDSDGLQDGSEVNEHGTDPNLADSDGDGLNDYEEVHEYKTDPTLADSDNDGLSDGNEVKEYNTDPMSADTDEDNLDDGREVKGWSIRVNGENRKVTSVPTSKDSDRDNLSDWEEFKEKTDPEEMDTDSDEISDFEELRSPPITDPADTNTDGDTISDSQDLAPTRAKGRKNPTRYGDNMAFLTSDRNWKKGLSLIPATVWTSSGNRKKFQTGYGTAENVRTYPMLIYHDETENGRGFDLDSIVHFLNQYSPSELGLLDKNKRVRNKVIGETNLDPDQVSTISNQQYFSLWENVKKVVYVEDNYELALMASTYASYMNVPLVIEGYKNNLSLENVNVIGVGDVEVNCAKKYTKRELQRAYLDKTGTKQVVLVNPDDWSIRKKQSFQTRLCGEPIKNLGGKTSLSAPILASAKHELILSIEKENYRKIDNILKKRLRRFGIVSDKLPLSKDNYNGVYLTVVASSQAIPFKVDEGELGEYPNCRVLDQTEYGDFNGDQNPDIYAGRVMGLTTGDVSAYIARNLFYKQIIKVENMKFFAAKVSNTIKRAKVWAENFRKAGYNAESITEGEVYPVFGPAEWENQQLISYEGHGGFNYGGIYSRELPLLSCPIVLSHSCSAGAKWCKRGFWLRVIRSGGIAWLGGVSPVLSGDSLFLETMSKIFHENQSLGKAFKNAYGTQGDNRALWMTAMLGDPTLKINPPYLLDGRIEFFI